MPEPRQTLYYAPCARYRDVPHRDCTTPRWGDGILDGGKTCDEGSQPKNDCVSDSLPFDD
jgi:hypothetical protein